MDLHRLGEERSVAYHRVIAERLQSQPEILENARQRVHAARIAAFLLIILGYEPILTSRFYTLGQYLTGIRVRRQDRHEEKIGLLASYVRYLVKVLLGFFSFFLIPYTQQRRAVHDWLAGSVMVNAADAPASSASPELG